MRKRTTLRQREARTGIRYLIPALCGFAFFSLIPLQVILCASLSAAGMGSFRWCGLRNYRELFASEAFLLALWNTARFLLVGLPAGILYAAGVALLLNDLELRGSRGYPVLFAMNLLPMVLPSGSVMLFFRVCFERYGIVNSLLSAPVDWLHGEITFWVLLLVYVWKSSGYAMILILAGLKNEDRAIHEAAALDGAGAGRCFFALTLPSLLPLMKFAVLLGTVQVFSLYRESYLLLGDYPNMAVYMLPNYLMNSFRSMNLNGMYAAATVFVLLTSVGVALTLQFGKGGKWDA